MRAIWLGIGPVTSFVGRLPLKVAHCLCRDLFIIFCYFAVLELLVGSTLGPGTSLDSSSLSRMFFVNVRFCLIFCL